MTVVSGARRAKGKQDEMRGEQGSREHEPRTRERERARGGARLEQGKTRQDKARGIKSKTGTGGFVKYM